MWKGSLMHVSNVWLNFLHCIYKWRHMSRHCLCSLESHWEKEASAFFLTHITQRNTVFDTKPQPSETTSNRELYWAESNVHMQWRVTHTWMCYSPTQNYIHLFLPRRWLDCAAASFNLKLYSLWNFVLTISCVELFVPVHYRQPKRTIITILLGWSSLDSLWMVAHVANLLLKLRGRSNWRNPKCSSRSFFLALGVSRHKWEKQTNI